MDYKDYVKKHLKPIDYDKEIKSLDTDKDIKFVDKATTTINLEWMKEQECPLYYPNDKTKPYIYMFVYNNTLCKVSAVTLKVLFINRSNGTWYSYGLSDKLLDMLKDKENDNVQNIIDSAGDTIEIFFPLKIKGKHASEAQVKLINSLFQQFEYKYTLTRCSQEMASLIIKALKSGKKINFTIEEEKNYTPEIKEEIDLNDQDAVDKMLDEMNEKKKREEELIKHYNLDKDFFEKFHNPDDLPF